ncbi:DUF998 domain-containing protein [Streptomyces sp. NPDC058662]|uniref:DUF998 domain-containing protein n=1 Tax=Streptomyces sp. NPDC058662 TaxID=3346583 RepID=UPI00366054B8
MAHTLSSPTDAVRSTADSRPVTRRLMAGGLVAGPLFLGMGVVQGLTRDGFDFTRNAISQLALGEPGWIQVANFLLTGAAVIAGAIGMSRALRGVPGGAWAPHLVGVFGASFPWASSPGSRALPPLSSPSPWELGSASQG